MSCTLLADLGGESLHAIVVDPTQQEQLERSIRSLLNKITPENPHVIEERLKGLDISSASDLGLLINTVLSVAEMETDRQSQYADLLQRLVTHFSSLLPEVSVGRITWVQSVSEAILNVCQQRFQRATAAVLP